MINRKAKSAVMRLASQFSVIAILGPRQSGKTTLAKMSFNDKPYITFDKIENKKLAIVFASQKRSEFEVFSELKTASGYFSNVLSSGKFSE